MSFTYLQLCQKLRQEVGIAGTGPESVLNQTGMMLKVVNWIADADVAIQSKWIDWTFLWDQFTQDTIDGTKDVTAPSDLRLWDETTFALDFGTSDYIKLRKMEYATWRSYYRSETNRPNFFVVKPNKDIILEPIPDDEYELSADYWKKATRMETNTAVSSIPDEFYRVIIAQAKIYYSEHENAPEVMQSAMMEYRELMNRLESEYLPGQHYRAKASNDMVITPE